jgi:hypothetical protein
MIRRWRRKAGKVHPPPAKAPATAEDREEHRAEGFPERQRTPQPGKVHPLPTPPRFAAAFVNWFVLWISGTIQAHDRQEKQIEELLQRR